MGESMNHTDRAKEIVNSCTTTIRESTQNNECMTDVYLFRASELHSSILSALKAVEKETEERVIEECARVADKMFLGIGYWRHLEDPHSAKVYIGNVAAVIRKSVKE